MNVEDRKWKEYLTDALINELELIRKNNEKYSLRSFAKKLKLSAGALSQLMNKNNNWNLTPERAVKIVGMLNLPEEQRNFLLASITTVVPIPREPLEINENEPLFDLNCTAILSCFCLPPTERSFDRIAARIGTDIAEVKKTVEFLLEKKFLIYNSAGEIETSPMHWRAGDVSSATIRKYHRESLQAAQVALDTVPMEERYYTNITFAGSREQMEAVKKEFELFLNRAMSLMNKGDKNDEVYRLAACMFPVRGEAGVSGNHSESH